MPAQRVVLPTKTFVMCKLGTHAGSCRYQAGMPQFSKSFGSLKATMLRAPMLLFASAVCRSTASSLSAVSHALATPRLVGVGDGTVVFGPEPLDPPCATTSLIGTFENNSK